MGAVLAIEASRLARNGRDWHTLIEFCGLVGTLIIDEDGIYEPRHPNDRLLLGMKGAPRQAAADGGFATRDNLATAKAWGVCDMAFHNKAGLRIEDMVRSKWTPRFTAVLDAGRA